MFLKNVKNVTRSMRKVVLLLVLAHHNAFNLHYGSRMVRRSERTIMHSNALCTYMVPSNNHRAYLFHLLS